MRHIDGGLKAELLDLIDAAVLQTAENGSRTLVARYLAEMAGLLAESTDPYEEAGEAEWRDWKGRTYAEYAAMQELEDGG